MAFGRIPASRYLWLAMLAVLLSGCFGGSPRLMPRPNLYEGMGSEVFDDVPEALRTSDIPVLFATDRFPLGSRSRDPLAFGAERSHYLLVGEVRIGVETVSTWEELAEKSLVPGRKKRPKLTIAEPNALLRYPGTFWKAARLDDPSDSFEDFLERRTQTRAQLHQLLGKWLDRTPKKEAFVFIHGYNNSFDDSVATMANIWHFMGRTGVPIAYSWPAGVGGLTGYTSDSESGEFTIYHLKMFLEDLAAHPDIEKINIIAHSRGTEVTITAIRELAIAERAKGLDPNHSLKLGSVILASPDIDLEVAGQRISSERLPDVPDRLTVYLSHKDRALRLSNWLHKGIARLGLISVDSYGPAYLDALLDFESLEMVDTRLETDFLGHGYFIHNPSASSDLIMLLRDKRPAGAATGRPLIPLGSRFWRLEEGYPAAK